MKAKDGVERADEWRLLHRYFPAGWEAAARVRAQGWAAISAVVIFNSARLVRFGERQEEEAESYILGLPTAPQAATA